MNMNKSLIALAVSGAFVVPGAAQAAEAYGSINTTLESSSVDNGGAGVIFNTNDDDTGVSMSDTWETRFGFTGSEDLGNGLEAGYTFEFGLVTSSIQQGSVNEDTPVNTRLSNLSLSGDFGTIKAGTQWGVIYEYAGWNNYRSDGHGGAAHYYMTSPFGGAFATSKDPSGLRIDNALTYTYGGGGYSSDPFTFSVQAQLDQNSTGNDEESVDALIVGAQSTIPNTGLTINGLIYTESNTDPAGGTAPEPSMFTLGGRYSFGPGLVSLTYYQGDTDASGNADREPNAFVLYGNYDFGGGLSGMASVSSGDADGQSSAGDLTAFFLQLQQELSSRTKIYGEFESAEIDGGSASDPATDTLAVGLKHSF